MTTEQGRVCSRDDCTNPAANDADLCLPHIMAGRSPSRLDPDRACPKVEPHQAHVWRDGEPPADVPFVCPGETAPARTSSS